MGQRSLFTVQCYLMYFHSDDDKHTAGKLEVETEWVDW